MKVLLKKLVVSSLLMEIQSLVDLFDLNPLHKLPLFKLVPMYAQDHTRHQQLCLGFELCNMAQFHHWKYRRQADPYHHGHKRKGDRYHRQKRNGMNPHLLA